MADEKLQELVTEYADLAKDKKIDAAALLINALEQQDQNRLAASTKRWAYLFSLGLPPFGLLFAIWFFASDKTDAKQAAWVCVTLTVLSALFSIIILKMILGGSGASVEQIQQIKPADIYELTQ